ncbi:fibronectin type III domain-containing protein [Parachryseolinea silvisoli]|uniref:fibronectin type III domain-containing protein n=1 Tax=Parachryseolinea silvisoli TaxID=2873601 RepID=UPI0022659CBD|nr:fibronectin type III domain-containing protein [Parachryseolinea silvisoli]MCD9017600.1 fibronectin type III domain-containing protein [Parachryseolinea silvisoli]
MRKTLKLVKKVLLIGVLMIAACAARLHAQTYPVQVSTQIAPPFSPYLSDYSAADAQRFMVNFLLKDPTLPEYRCKLRLTIEGVGITIRTKQSFVPQPLVLPGGGIPLQVYGEELEEYFNPNNLDFAGFSKAQYTKGAKLPDGVYRFTVEVLDYNRGTVVSNKGTAVAFIILNDPPLLNMPRTDTKVRILDPTNIPFTWTPRHTGSPNAAFTTEYIFRLVEIWPVTRNPYDAFLSQQPLYEITTNATQIVYGPAEPALIPGRKYAWQVQAKDVEGRDLFKNQGKSEVFVFQFGDALGAPEGLYLQTANPTSLVVRWEQNVAGTDAVKYRVRYRPHKGRAHDNWYEEESEEQWRALSQLQPETEYEVQVRAEQSVQVSEYGPVKVFKTALPGANEFVCKSDVSPPPAPTTNAPAVRLGINDTIHAGGYDVLVRELSENNNGVYTGSGMAIVPWFMSAKVRVTFKKINVNEQHWLTSGEIKSVWNPDSKFLLTPDKKPDPTTRPTNGEVPVTVAETETLIEIDGAVIVDVSKNEDGDIVVNTSDGETKTLEKGKSYSIVDAAGNGYIVDKEGNVAKTTAQEARDAAGRGDRNYTIALRFEKGLAVFGFDEKKYDALASNYQQLEGGQYIPWKAVTSSRQDVVNAVLDGTDIDPKKVRFEVNGSPVTHSGFSGGVSTVDMPGKTEGTVEELLALYKPADAANENVLGKLNLVSYDKVTSKLVVVPVNDNGVPGGLSAAAITQKLNDIYGQAVAAWEVKIDPSLSVTLDATFDEGESGMLTNYTDDMKKVINAYGPFVDKTYYLFLVSNPHTNPDAVGYMPRAKQAGFLFVDNLNADNVVAAIGHELGHGAFNLKHTFSEFGGLTKGTTDNLMDYNHGTALYKYQWDYVHEPQRVFGLFEDDEESESALITLADASITGIAWGFDENPDDGFEGGASFILANGSVLVFKKGISAERLANGYFKIGSEEYVTMFYVDEKGGVSDKFMGLYETTKLATLTKKDDGGWKKSDLDNGKGWFSSENYKLFPFIRDHTMAYSKDLLARKDINVDKAIQISLLLEQFTDEMYEAYQQSPGAKEGPCRYIMVSEPSMDYSDCWDELIKSLEGYLQRQRNAIEALIAEIDKPKIDRSVIKDRFVDLEQSNYGILTVTERTKLLSYLVTGAMVGDYYFFGGEESFAVKTLKNTPPEQVQALLAALEAKPVMLNCGEKAANASSSLMYNLNSKVHDGILGLAAGNYTEMMAVIKNLLLKSPDFEDRLLRLFEDDIGKRTVSLHAHVPKPNKEGDYTYIGTTLELQFADWAADSKGNQNSHIHYKVEEEVWRDAESVVVSMPTGEGVVEHTLAPFELVALTNYSDLSIVDAATESPTGQVVFVPVIFLKYIDIKSDNDAIQDVAFNILDAATMVTGAGAIVKLTRATAAVNKWIKYGKIALRALEVANAAGNLTLRNMQSEFPDPEFKEAVEWSDKVMLAIGAAELIRGGVKGIPKALSSAKTLTYAMNRATAYGFVKAIIKVEGKLSAKAASKKAAQQMLELKNKIVNDWKLKHGEDLEDVIRKEMAIALKVEELFAAFKVKLTTRVGGAKGFTLKHTDKQIKAMMQKGLDLDLPEDVIEDFIFISCRDDKPIAAAELMNQMDNWVNVVSNPNVRGYPYKFLSKDQFEAFSNELKAGLDKIGIPSDNVRIQGSSLRTPDAKDVDMAVLITDADFDQFLVKRFSKRIATKAGTGLDLTGKSAQELRQIADDIFTNPGNYNSQAESFSKAMRERKIGAYSNDKIIPGHKDLYHQMQASYANLAIDNLTVQTAGGAFDLKPFITL